MLLTTMEQRPKVVRHCVNMCDTTQHVEKPLGGSRQTTTPANDIQPPQADQGEQRHNRNFRNPSREAKHQRDLLKDYFNHVGALAGPEDRV